MMLESEFMAEWCIVWGLEFGAWSGELRLRDLKGKKNDKWQ